MTDGLQTFVGFYPADPLRLGLVDLDPEPDGSLSDEAQRALRATRYEFAGPGYTMRVATDYLCLLRSHDLDPGFAERRQQKRNVSDATFPAGYWTHSESAWAWFLRALNCWYFCIFASAHTARGHYFLHEFRELSRWDCTRVLYDSGGSPLRQVVYGPRTTIDLARRGELLVKQPSAATAISEGLFTDAAAYWEALSRCDSLRLGAVGAKLVSAHRASDYQVTVALGWFEIESWIRAVHQQSKYPTKVTTSKGQLRDKNVADMIDDFPKGASIGRVADQLHRLRRARNRVAHDNAEPSFSESALALECFGEKLAALTGVAIRIDTKPPGSSSLT